MKHKRVNGRRIREFDGKDLKWEESVMRVHKSYKGMNDGNSDIMDVKCDNYEMVV